MTLNRPQDVREQYRDSGNFSSRVDIHVRFSTNPYGWNAWMFDRLDLGPDARVLEVGCGPAYLWRSSLARVPDGWRVVCTDMSPGMASEARPAVSDVRFAFGCADVQSLPFREEIFDAVVANHMLYHVPDLDLALSEFARVLRPGGRLFAATNGRAHLAEIRDLIRTVSGSSSTWPYIEAFGLETGPDKIASWFDDVTVERYDDSLDVTETEPILRYITSMSTFWRNNAHEDEIRRRVAELIAADGVFHVQKDAGLIRARRR